jgi:hypothetical protein
MGEGSNALLVVVLAAGIVIAAAPMPVNAGARMLADRIDHAPVARRIVAASGRYALSVESVDGWKTPRATATLTDAAGRVRWRMILPHEGGPRAMLVSKAGAVLFVDEWINVIPRHALMVVAPTGKVIGDHAGESILSLLKVPRRTIGDLARVGPWRSSDAVLSADGQHASLTSGGRTVTISLVDGSVKVSA